MKTDGPKIKKEHLQYLVNIRPVALWYFTVFGTMSFVKHIGVVSFRGYDSIKNIDQVFT